MLLTTAHGQAPNAYRGSPDESHRASDAIWPAQELAEAHAREWSCLSSALRSRESRDPVELREHEVDLRCFAVPRLTNLDLRPGTIIGRATGRGSCA